MSWISLSLAGFQVIFHGRFWAIPEGVQPIDPELLALVLEDWDIWNRWSDAFDRGEASQETHPARSTR
jgi:hypothetical protein